MAWRMAYWLCPSVADGVLFARLNRRADPTVLASLVTFRAFSTTTLLIINSYLGLPKYSLDLLRWGILFRQPSKRLLANGRSKGGGDEESVLDEFIDEDVKIFDRYVEQFGHVLSGM